MPLYCCHTSCPWVNWTSVFMGLKLSSYLEIFSASKYEVLFSILLSLTSCWIPSTYILVFLKLLKVLWWTINFFPHSFHYYFPCLYLTYSILFSFRNIRIIVVVSILMSFPANYVMYIFNCVFTNWFFHHYGYFLASLHIQDFFFFLNLFIFIWG